MEGSVFVPFIYAARVEFLFGVEGRWREAEGSTIGRLLSGGLGYLGEKEITLVVPEWAEHAKDQQLGTLCLTPLQVGRSTRRRRRRKLSNGIFIQK